MGFGIWKRSGVCEISAIRRGKKTANFSAILSLVSHSYSSLQTVCINSSWWPIFLLILIFFFVFCCCLLRKNTFEWLHTRFFFSSNETILKCFFFSFAFRKNFFNLNKEAKAIRLWSLFEAVFTHFASRREEKKAQK